MSTPSTPETGPAAEGPDIGAAWRHACEMDASSTFFEGPHYADARARRIADRDQALDVVQEATGVEREVLLRTAMRAADAHLSDPADLEVDRYAEPDWAQLRGDAGPSHQEPDDQEPDDQEPDGDEIDAEEPEA